MEYLAARKKKKRNVIFKRMIKALIPEQQHASVTAVKKVYEAKHASKWKAQVAKLQKTVKKLRLKVKFKKARPTATSEAAA